MESSYYTQICRRIPDRIRDERILVPEDPIANAMPNGSNKPMRMLANIWWEFVEPKPEGDRDYKCPACLSGILNNWRQLKQTLIDIRDENELLKRL